MNWWPEAGTSSDGAYLAWESEEMHFAIIISPPWRAFAFGWTWQDYEETNNDVYTISIGILILQLEIENR